MVEYKRRALLLHPDKNNGDTDACEKFRLLQEAKEVLTDETSRRKYDRWLNSGLAIPYKKWLQLNQSGQTFHWAKSSVTKPMVTEKEAEKSSKVNLITTSSRQEFSDARVGTRKDLIQMFRNYDIWQANNCKSSV